MLQSLIQKERITDVELYWNEPPPTLSNRCVYWIVRYLEGGFRPNRRIRAFGYYEAAEWYGIYIWEYRYVISPLERVSHASK
jgi:hypothetical protein